MSVFANPYLLYAGIVLGALGVSLAMPRRGVSPQQIGALVAALGLGLGLLALGLKAGDARPPIYFYVFSLIALGASLRVITHPRPVYAALYFILTILSSAGLYLLLSAEFMAFALVIIYAGAILITYLFVIMLATEAPSAEEVDSLSEYDKYAREPILSTVTGFLLLAALVGLLARGVAQTAPAGPEVVARQNAAMLSRMPRTWTAVREALVREEGIPEDARLLRVDADGSALVEFTSGWGGSATRQFVRPMSAGERMEFPIPASVRVQDIEKVGFTLVGGHPLGLELAGVILLMAMLGAVVLARKQVQIEEARKEQQAASKRLGASMREALVAEQATGGALT